jgi:hypothetical protein
VLGFVTSPQPTELKSRVLMLMSFKFGKAGIELVMLL